MTAHDPYEEAVDRFEALANSVLSQAAETPRQLIMHSEIPKSTGYRAIGALEKTGFLSRDANGDYLRGDVAWQIGLTAWGFGRGHNAVLPLVRYLRAQTRRTACFCVLSGGMFHVGPFSVARGSDHVFPSRPTLPFRGDPGHPEHLELDSDGTRISAVWAPTTSRKALHVAGFAILARSVVDSHRNALVTQVRAVAQMARAARALEQNNL